MIPTSIGTLQVGSPWLSRQWINTIPGVQVTAGITQNNLTIRAGNKRPSFTPGQPLPATSGSTGGGGTGGRPGGGIDIGIDVGTGTGTGIGGSGSGSGSGSGGSGGSYLL